MIMSVFLSMFMLRNGALCIKIVLMYWFKLDWEDYESSDDDEDTESQALEPLPESPITNTPPSPYSLNGFIKGGKSTSPSNQG